MQCFNQNKPKNLPQTLFKNQYTFTTLSILWKTNIKEKMKDKLAQEHLNLIVTILKKKSYPCSTKITE